MFKTTERNSMNKVFNFSGGSLVVRKNGFGVDKQCPETGNWSVLFLSLLTNAETASLFGILENRND